MKKFALPFMFLLGFWCVDFAAAQTQFQASPENPVISPGESGTWDTQLVFAPEVLFFENHFYLFYSGSNNAQTMPFSIGLAISDDGETFTKSGSNPVLAPDGGGFDAHSIAASVVIRLDTVFYMYYTARAAAGPGPGNAIGLAYSGSPQGPWTRNERPVLSSGADGSWDDSFILYKIKIKL